MDVGLLWYDNDPTSTLEDKIGRAAQRYREKYGRWPDTCYVHAQADTFPPGQREGEGCWVKDDKATIRVVAAPNILLHHLWLGEGVGDSPKGRRKAPN